MTAYIGVVSHPHFAVTGTDGTFKIANVPVGTYDIQSWHERYGTLTQPVRVRPGATTAVSVVYTGSEKAPLAAVQDPHDPCRILMSSRRPPKHLPDAGGLRSVFSWRRLERPHQDTRQYGFPTRHLVSD